MSTPTDFVEISENLSFLDDWEDRYRYLIELGQKLTPISDEERSLDNKVQGCVSQVWLVVDDVENGDQSTLVFRGDSDAMIVKGLVAILVALHSNTTAQQIAATDAIAVLDELGLREHLTAQRSNGLVAMVQRIQTEAAARLS